MRLQCKNGQFSLTLPKAVIDGIGWKKQDVIQVKIVGKGRLELVKPSQ